MPKVIPNIIQAKDHGIDEHHISSHALSVLDRLVEAGFDAYLVGGCVRDIMLGLTPKDFDVVTDAHPEQIKKIFRNCRLIGRRFRLAHIYYGRHIIEVATFRSKEEGAQELSEEGMILRDNVYGTLDDDVTRRDFTVNAFYYDYHNKTVLDYYDGLSDLKNKTMRLIGEPVQRYREDPVRMLRAIRFAAKLNFKIDKPSEKLIPEMAGLFHNVPAARLFDELMKVYRGGYAFSAFNKMRQYNVFQEFFPLIAAHFTENDKAEKMMNQVLKNADDRIRENKSLSPAFLFASLLWYPITAQMKKYQKQNIKLFPALKLANETIIHQQLKTVAIPKRFRLMMYDIWVMQWILPRRIGKRAYRTLNNRYFRAAYDFLLLRAEVGEDVKTLADWWTIFQDAVPNKQRKMIDKLRNEK